MNLESHLNLMFEESLHSDLYLLFRHPKHALELSFHVHKSILSQSSFFQNLITHDNNTIVINLTKEWTRYGFTHYQGRMTIEQLKLYIEKMLKWFYCIKKQEEGLVTDSNVLDVLSLAILFDIPPIYNECIDRYIRKLDMDCIMRDVDLICQFPREHPVYVKIRHHMFLILFRSCHPEKLAQLPVDYLDCVLSSDLLFVSNEFHRYCLLKRVFCVVDPNNPLLRRGSDSKKSNSGVLPFLDKDLVMTTSEARSQKRKRVQSKDTWDKAGAKRRKLELGGASRALEEQDDDDGDINRNENGYERERTFNDISKNNCNNTDKPTALIKLLKTAILYSNMTFKQLSMVREDEIVDEDIIFRALWERETLERIIDPTSYNLMLSQPPSTDDNNAATVLENGGDKKQISPRFRFTTTVFLTSPKSNNKDDWTCQVDDNNTILYKQSFYSKPERLPFGSYQVEVIAETSSYSDDDPPPLSLQQQDTQYSIHCKFRLKPVTQKTATPSSLSLIPHTNYWIYCFNKHEREGEPVTVQTSDILHHQFVISTDFKEALRIDIAVVGEILRCVG
ncbi:hypothetical protein K501DRAFT_270405 [Backusella circina FSU 941]|nr:hypothetical protein K501DRAFT_270405 [Backusella circina FSU 941]